MAAIGRIFLLVIASAALLGACGSDDGSIPEESADMLLTRLDEVERGLEQGKCDDEGEGAPASAALLEQHTRDEDDGGELPEGVDDDVREALRRGAERLVELVGQRCEELAEEAEEAEEPIEEEPIEEEPIEEPPTDEEADPEDDQGENDDGDDGNEGGGNEGGGNQGRGNQGSGGPGGGGDEGDDEAPSGGTGG